MSVHPHICRVATTWAGNFVADDLVVPLQGASDVPLALVLGTLRSDLLSVTYALSVLTFAFAPGVIAPGVAIVPSVELGTATLPEVAVSNIDPAAGTFAIIFRTAAGAPASPPGNATGARLALAIFRPLPVR